MTYDELHVPLLPVLRMLLKRMAFPETGLALDLAGGAGEKLPMLRAAAPGLRWIVVDSDRAAVQRASAAAVAGDAHTLPFAANTLDAAVCIASLGLFAQPAQALAEMRRVLRPDAPLLVVSAEMRWAEVTAWPASLAAHVDMAALPPPPDATEALANQLAAAGFRPGWQQAALLHPDHAPDAATLALLPRATLAPHVPFPLPDTAVELELVPVVLAVLGRATAVQG